MSQNREYALLFAVASGLQDSFPQVMRKHEALLHLCGSAYPRKRDMTEVEMSQNREYALGLKEARIIEASFPQVIKACNKETVARRVRTPESGTR